VNLHDKMKKVKGIPFIGWGGAPTPFNTIVEPSEEETAESLEKMHARLKAEPFVLVVHNPPKDTKLDVTFSKRHVGSAAIRKFIEEKQPILAISAHIHESRGVDKLGKTTLFYPGALFEGYYGVVEIGPRMEVKCETRKIKV